MVITKNDIFLGGFVVSSIAVVTAALFEMRTIHKVSKKLKRTTEDLIDEDIDISEEIIEDAVDRAVERFARVEVSKAMDKATGKIIEKYKTEIENAVEEEFNLQKGEVAKTLKRKIDNIDISEIKRQVKLETKQACVEKLKNDLDDLSDKYTEQIESMASIYETVANKIQAIGD